ncbi:MAG TPA: hypothetical protein VKD72_37475, partial [Gemmataceae bacterium]|nr:hypothetical protein [Gemmataceae bacterium]
MPVVRTSSPALRAGACLAGLLLAWVIALVPGGRLQADSAASAPPKDTATEGAKDDKPAPVRIEDVKLPTSDAILVICERAGEALRVLPKYYYGVPPKDYEALLTRIDQLNKQLQARQPVPISEVKLSGQVKGNGVELTATFTFITDKDGATVALGCGQADAGLRSVLLDDAVPRLRNSPKEGLFLEVENAGRHTATVKMVLALGEIAPAPPPPGAAARPTPAEPLEGFKLDLPLAPTTRLDALELPEGTRSVEVNGQSPGAFVQVEKNQVSATLGKASELKVGWKKPAPASATPILLASSQGKIRVHLDPKEVRIKAELTLTDHGRSVRDWKLQLPERADVQLTNPADRDRLRGEIQGNKSKEGAVTIPLKAPSAAPLSVTVSLPKLSRGSGPLALGPFAVLGAASQGGFIWVDQRVRCLPFS